MPRKCKTCLHPRQRDIDKKLIQGISIRNIAKQFSLSPTSVYRHKNHIIETLSKAKDIKEKTNSESLMEEISNLQARALNILSRTEEAEDWRAANGAIREVRGCLELLGKLAGELRDGHTINVILTPQWIELRTTIIQALEAYPKAKLSVMRALDESTYE